MTEAQKILKIMIPGRGAVWFSVPEWGSELRGFGKVSIILRNIPEPLILLGSTPFIPCYPF